MMITMFTLAVMMVRIKIVVTMTTMSITRMVVTMVLVLTVVIVKRTESVRSRLSRNYLG